MFAGFLIYESLTHEFPNKEKVCQIAYENEEEIIGLDLTAVRVLLLLTIFAAFTIPVSATLLPWVIGLTLTGLILSFGVDMAAAIYAADSHDTKARNKIIKELENVSESSENIIGTLEKLI